MDRPIIGRDRGSELTTAALYRQGCLKPSFDFMPFTIRAIRGGTLRRVRLRGSEPHLSPNKKGCRRKALASTLPVAHQR
jgi:hypothetical protein